MSTEIPAGHTSKVTSGWCTTDTHDACPQRWEVVRHLERKKTDIIYGECICECHHT